MRIIRRIITSASSAHAFRCITADMTSGGALRRAADSFVPSALTSPARTEPACQSD